MDFTMASIKLKVGSTRSIWGLIRPRSWWGSRIAAPAWFGGISWRIRKSSQLWSELAFDPMEMTRKDRVGKTER